MRLAFVHGINNQMNTPDDIRDRWWEAIERGWQDLGLTPKPKPEIDVGYYATTLADAVAGRPSGAVAQGGDMATRSHGHRFLQAYMDEADMKDHELASAMEAAGHETPEVVEQGWFQEKLVDAAGAIEKVLHNRGKWLARHFLSQATHYIEDKGLAAQIGLMVRQQIFDNHDEPVLLVSHSLGTVVSYKLLSSDQKLRKRAVPMFVTLGSPLGIGMMQEILPPRETIPNPPIAGWVNGYRRDDFVALDRPLTPKTVGLTGIHNINEGLHDDGDPHSVAAYLQSPPICARIHDAL
jgi:hypothetical protein